MADEHWEREVLAQLARDALDERRRARRWGILWKSLGFGFLFAAACVVLVMVAARERICLEKCTALVEVRGELDSAGRASAERVIAALQAAFKNPGTKGVVVRINSPGGSPVQAGQIHNEMRRLRGLNPNIPLHVVIEEIAASGGYYIAAAGDRIYVDKASVVGSIGAIIEGFGFTGAMEKIGVDRRVIKAGDNKAFLDPFEPVDERQREHVQRMVDEIHQQFIAAVKAGRGDRLKEEPGIFSGLVWNGQRAIELGLADELGTLDSVARDVIMAEELVDFTPEDNIAERVARKFGAGMGAQLGAALRTSGAALR
jgi:protease-4